MCLRLTSPKKRVDRSHWQGGVPGQGALRGTEAGGRNRKEAARGPVCSHLPLHHHSQSTFLCFYLILTATTGVGQGRHLVKEDREPERLRDFL